MRLVILEKISWDEEQRKIGRASEMMWVWPGPKESCVEN